MHTLHGLAGFFIYSKKVKSKSEPCPSRSRREQCHISSVKHFTFIDQTGRRLRPIVSRFRATGAQITAYYQGDIANNVMLNNTPDIRKRHYNKGNEITNKGMLQDAMAIREEQIKSKVNTKQARENLKIEVLVIDAEYKINIPNLRGLISVLHL